MIELAPPLENIMLFVPTKTYVSGNHVLSDIFNGDGQRLVRDLNNKEFAMFKGFVFWLVSKKMLEGVNGIKVRQNIRDIKTAMTIYLPKDNFEFFLEELTNVEKVIAVFIDKDRDWVLDTIKRYGMGTTNPELVDCDDDAR